MIPSVLSKQLQIGLSDYVLSSFPVSNKYFKNAISDFVKREGALFHEPYYSIKLPFRTSNKSCDIFESICVKFAPHMHQIRSFERLCGEDPKSTIIATGTGSGKTECFLYPILEYCYQHRNEKGIKALLVYPMNALATDQAKRIAELIADNEKLNGNITAGLYVGGVEEKPSQTMTEINIITDHKTLLENPPSILLTNYKMLDFLLVRPKDAKIWKDNLSTTLKFIVVDELHTFDGAQGTDLSCLIRRLKKRLNSPKDWICSIGTSATIGDISNYDKVRGYASDIFDDDFDNESLIDEDRVSVDEFIKDSYAEYDNIPSKYDIKELKSIMDESKEEAFIDKAYRVWFEEEPIDVMSDDFRVSLSEKLKRHIFFIDLLNYTNNSIFQYSKVVKDLSSRYTEMNDIEDYSILFDSIIALISHARIKIGGRLTPFLTVHAEIWIRELSRMVSKVSHYTTEIALSADLNDQQATQYLPIVNCRECGATGWATLENAKHNASIHDLDYFYQSFFKGDENILMLFPSDRNDYLHELNASWLCPHCMHIETGYSSSNVCPECNNEMMFVTTPVKLEVKPSHGFVCPICHSKRGMSIVGFRGASEISVCLSQLYSSKFNDDKKVIAFTDNVQDASHHASFYNSRTNRFILRNSIQRYADSLIDEQSLVDFANGFISTLRDNETDEEFISKYIPPGLTWLESYDSMVEKGILENGIGKTRLLSFVQDRLKYEVMLEYGIESRNGRTLENTCTSGLSFKEEDLKNISESVKANLIQNGITKVTDIEIKRSVFYVLTQLRYFGAFIDDAYKMMITEATTYAINPLPKNTLCKYKWLPAQKHGRNTPSFLCDGDVSPKGSYFNTIDKSIYHKQVSKICSDLSGAEVLDVIKNILTVATSNKILLFLPSKKCSVWAINKNKIFVTTKVHQYICDRCGSPISIADDNKDYIINGCCLVTGCKGHYIESNNVSSYYHNLYKNGDISKIIATEHTGLLTRIQRERVESAFKSKGDDRKPWYYNLLSATPTLEMGIDIGDLSTVVMCSVPPGQSQYFQRSGRAGRKDGNSLNIVISKSRPYDQYYYAEPLEMVSGIISAPKIFLSASAVLKRQLTAFSLDTWVKNEADEKSIPRAIGKCISNIGKPGTRTFPYNFIEYLDKNIQSLFDNFISLFHDKIDQSTIDELHRFAFDDPSSESKIKNDMVNAFTNLKAQVDSLNKEISECCKQIAIIESKPQDPSFDIMKTGLINERDALRNVIRGIAKKNVFNFLSDESIIPNYMFPEAGTILKAILFRSSDETSLLQNTKKIVYDYQRPSSSAITEFALTNSFYADGHKFTIDRVDLSSAEIEEWRLCPNCSHMQLNSSLRDVSSCPRCGCTSWADVGQLRSMIKTKMVYSIHDYNCSLVSDDDDSREFKIYNKQMLVDIDDKKDITRAHSIETDEYSFGYEYIKKATIREINFGEKDELGIPLTVAGVLGKRKGFTICKECGRIQNSKNGIGKHAVSCSYYGSSNNAEYERCLFIYRDFITEAIRILVPTLATESTDARVESFVASFMLGMKEYFGNVEHLRVCVSQVPIPDTDQYKMYLVIYDSVPGGTGYLNQLMQESNSMIEVLEKSLSRMKSCSCKDDPQKDGCYHCLYSYKQSNNVSVSRKLAIAIIESILKEKDNLKEIKRISDISINSMYDSELEKLFIEKLNIYCTKNGLPSLKTTTYNNKPSYIMKIGKGGWVIEPQVDLDESKGVCVNTRPDFIMWPLVNDQYHKPVAIYTDGFSFHKDSMADDTLKRNAILLSGKFRVWSLSWNDVKYYDTIPSEHNNILSPESMPQGSMFGQIMSKTERSLKPNTYSAFQLLIRYLEEDKAEELFWMNAKAYALSLLDMKKRNSIKDRKDWIEEFSQLDVYSNKYNEICNENIIFGKWAPSETEDIKMYSAVTQSEIQQKMDAKITVLSYFNDDVNLKDKRFEKDWNDFWHFYNMMQFLDKEYIAVTENGIDLGVYMPLLMR